MVGADAVTCAFQEIFRGLKKARRRHNRLMNRVAELEIIVDQMRRKP